MKRSNNPESAWFYFAIQEATNSHFFGRKMDSVNEVWTELRESPTWAALEKTDSIPYDVTY